MEEEKHAMEKHHHQTVKEPPASIQCTKKKRMPLNHWDKKLPNFTESEYLGTGVL